MNITRALLVSGAMVAALAGAGVGAAQECGSSGPDVITGEIQSTRLWARDEVETAYTFGFTGCNVGDEPVLWQGNPSHLHPLRTSNLFRLSADGRFEHLGYSWIYHAFCALQATACCECNGGGGCQSVLHPGCSSPNTASGAGSQGGLGPKWQVNPHTVEFVLPWHQGEGTDGSFRRRIRVRNEDLDPARHPGARYFAEVQYLAPDDAAAGNQNNGASYREISIDPETFAMTFAGPTRRTRPGIQAWQDADPGVSIVPVQIDADGARDEHGRFDDGLLIVGSAVTALGEGAWRYEYAVQNLNAHRAARTFAVPVPAGALVTDAGFHDIDHHSGDGIGGENFDGTAWPMVRAAGQDGDRGGDELRWETQTFEANESANALRWGTLYNFRFTADAPPAPATGRMDLFRPGDPAAVTFTVPAPTLCRADLDGSGAVDFGDVLAVLAAWGPCPPHCPADLDGSGVVDFADVLIVLGSWGPCA